MSPDLSRVFLAAADSKTGEIVGSIVSKGKVTEVTRRRVEPGSLPISVRWANVEGSVVYVHYGHTVERVCVGDDGALTRRSALDARAFALGVGRIYYSPSASPNLLRSSGEGTDAIDVGCAVGQAWAGLRSDAVMVACGPTSRGASELKLLEGGKVTALGTPDNRRLSDAIVLAGTAGIAVELETGRERHDGTIETEWWLWDVTSREANRLFPNDGMYVAESRPGNILNGESCGPDPIPAAH
jgi:hypothetical protein